MATTNTIIKATPEPTVTTPTQPQHLPPPEVPTTASATDSKDALTVSRLPDAEVISIPSYSKWFSWDKIHPCELRYNPEFFDGRSPSKNPKVYKYYRNAIIQRYRENPTKKITFTEVRKTIIGDVGSIRRVFDFLENWGLINYTASTSKAAQLKSDDKEAKSTTAAAAQGAAEVAALSTNADSATSKKWLCGACKSPCTIACFACDKYDLTLCARCYVRGKYRVGVNSSDFRRVQINEEVKTDWSDKETLHLLEAVMHYGDDWKKVAAHVGGGRSEKESVARFVKLPFGEQFVGPPESSELDNDLGSKNSSLPDKRMRLTPLADASNPIMAQVKTSNFPFGEKTLTLYVCLRSSSKLSKESFFNLLACNHVGQYLSHGNEIDTCYPMIGSMAGAILIFRRSPFKFCHLEMFRVDSSRF